MIGLISHTLFVLLSVCGGITASECMCPSAAKYSGK